MVYTIVLASLLGRTGAAAVALVIVVVIIVVAVDSPGAITVDVGYVVVMYTVLGPWGATTAVSIRV